MEVKDPINVILNTSDGLALQLTKNYVCCELAVLHSLIPNNLIYIFLDIFLLMKSCHVSMTRTLAVPDF